MGFEGEPGGGYQCSPSTIEPEIMPAKPPIPPSQCSHRVFGTTSVLTERAPKGNYYQARCLLCGTVGLARVSRKDARRALLEEKPQRSPPSSSAGPLAHLLLLEPSEIARWVEQLYATL